MKKILTTLITLGVLVIIPYAVLADAPRSYNSVVVGKNDFAHDVACF